MVLGPMCAHLPEESPVASAPVAAPVATPVAVAVSTPIAAGPAPKVEAPKPEAPKAPVVKAASPAAAGDGLIVATYRSKKSFAAENGKYLVAVTRTNKSDKKAVGIRMALLVKGSGQTVAKTQNRRDETQDAGASDYFGLYLSTSIVDAVLDGPDEPGTELEWDLTYKLEGDDAARCFTLRALPRRREPEGIAWVSRGSSAVCPKP